MPTSAAHPCSSPGCRALVRVGSRCPAHPPAKAASRSGSVDPFYNTGRWRSARKAYLRKHPFCVRCGQPGTHVDHVVPIAVAPQLAWTSSNWQALCLRCHARKTASQDGGYGNRRANQPPTPRGAPVLGASGAASVLCTLPHARPKLESDSGTNHVTVSE
jgi:5-methylcytosine-specific restriction protein A